MTMTNMKRRMEQLEAGTPGQDPGVRILFKRDGDPDPVVDPPLRPLENVIVVNFVPPRRAHIE